MATLQENLTTIVSIRDRYQLDVIQLQTLAEVSESTFNNIIASATYGRWDQVTLMLIQEKIIDKWPT